MICPICKNEIKDDSKFCGKCGKKIPRCPTCGNVLSKKVRFCTNDGTPLPEDIFSDLPDFEQSISGKSKNDGVSKRPRRKRKIFLFLFVLLLVGIVAVLGYSIYKGNDSLELFCQNITEKFRNEIDGNSKEEKDNEEDLSVSDDKNETIEDISTSAVEDASVSVEENENDEQEIVGETQEVTQTDPLEYFILNCDRQYFTKEDLSDFDEDMCRLARNGIYARLGREFQDESLMDYFLQFDWYVPSIDPDEFSDDLLNEYQIANRDLIVEFEEEQGYR